jgi:hypothetical protein
MSKLPQRSRPSGPGDTVEMGRGTRPFEQLGPEQGLRNGAPAGTSGDCPPSRRIIDDVPFMISSSSWCRLANRSDRELTGWVQPARAEPGALKRPATSSMAAAAPHFVNRPDRKTVIPPPTLERAKYRSETCLKSKPAKWTLRIECVNLRCNTIHHHRMPPQEAGEKAIAVRSRCTGESNSFTKCGERRGLQ